MADNDVCLVEKPLKRVYVKAQEKYAYLLRGSPALGDSSVLEGV